MTILLGVVILLGTLIGGVYLYAQTSGLARDIERHEAARRRGRRGGRTGRHGEGRGDGRDGDGRDGDGQDGDGREEDAAGDRDGAVIFGDWEGDEP